MRSWRLRAGGALSGRVGTEPLRDEVKHVQSAFVTFLRPQLVLRTPGDDRGDSDTDVCAAAKLRVLFRQVLHRRFEVVDAAFEDTVWGLKGLECVAAATTLDQRLVDHYSGDDQSLS